MLQAQLRDIGVVPLMGAKIRNRRRQALAISQMPRSMFVPLGTILGQGKINHRPQHQDRRQRIKGLARQSG